MKRNIISALTLLIMILMVILCGCTKTYHVNFLYDDGEIIDTITVAEGKKINKPVDPIKEGYTFIGWFCNDEQWIFSGYTVTEDINLVAKYQINEYTITFDTDGGTAINSITQAYNSVITMPNNPTKGGYTFVGWDKQVPNTMPAENITIKAIWNKILLFGFSAPLTGTLSYFGLAVKKGVELALEEINAAGGININGNMTQLEIEFMDDQADSSKVVEVLNSLISENVDVVIGSVSSGVSEILAQESIKYGVPVITPTATAEQITNGTSEAGREDRLNIFRGCITDYYQGQYMAKYTKENGYNKAYVLYLAGDYYCEILKDGYVAEAAVQGFDVVVESYLSGYGYSYWDKIISGGYKCVYIAGYYNDVHNIIKTGYALGYTGVCYGCDGWDGLIDQFAVGEDVSYLEKCFYICQFNAKSNNEEVKKFVTAYQNKYNGEVPLTFAALGYDSVYIAKQAIEKSGSADYDKVIEALTNSTFSGLVTSNGEFKFVDGNPQKKPFIISFKGNMEVVVE